MATYVPVWMVVTKFTVSVALEKAVMQWKCLQQIRGVPVTRKKFVTHLGANYKKILRLSYDVIITYDNRKSNLR